MKVPVVLAVLIGTLVLACSTVTPAPAEPTPNIDATVEARVAQERAVDATIEARAKELVAEQPTVTPYPTTTPYPTYTPVPTATPPPKPTNTPAPQRINTPEPTPTNTPTLVPTATSVPTPTPTPTPAPTPTPTPTPRYTYIGPGLEDGKYLRSEILQSDLRLTLVESPYWFEGQIQVPAGITVFVEPGVEVHGESPGHSEFKMSGSFYAVGTKSQPIVFKRFTIQPSGGVTYEEKLTIANVNATSFGARYFGKGEVTDSVFRDTFFTGFSELIIKRNVFRKRSDNDNAGAYSQFSVGRLGDLEVVNNCFDDATPLVGGNFHSANYVIEHNTFNTTYQTWKSTKWFTIGTGSQTNDVSIANNYWYGLGDRPISDFVKDGRTDMEIEARFIATPLLSTPHRDTPDCILD